MDLFFLANTGIIPLIAGVIFCALAIAFYLDYRRFSEGGDMVKGRVKAIEKYVSESMDLDRPSGKIRRIFYRPIVEYKYKGKEYILKNNVGSNEIRYKLNQQVPVMVVEDDGRNGQISARLKDSSNILFPIVFISIGLLAFWVYFSQLGGSVIVVAVAFGLSVGLGKFIATLMKRAEATLSPIKSSLNAGEAGNEQNSSLEGFKSKGEDSVIIDTEAAYKQEISNHRFWGQIISYGLMVASIYVIYLGYSQLPDSARQLLLSDIGGFWGELTSEMAPESWKKAMMVLGIGVFFFLASLRSCFYIRKKYGGSARI